MPFGTSLPARLPASTGTEYWVSTTGNDTTGDGSFGNPWRTIQKAFDNVSLTGSIINLRGGTYATETQAEWTRAGSSTNPVLLRPHLSEPIILTGCRIYISGSYLRIGYLEITAATSGLPDGIKLENAANIEIVGCNIHDNPANGILAGPALATPATDIQIWDTITHNNGSITGQHHGLYLGNCPNIVVANVLSYANIGYGVQWYPNTDNGIMTCCTFDDHANAGATVFGPETGSVSDNSWYGIIVTNSAGWGVDDYNGGGTELNDNVYDSIGTGNALGDFQDIGRIVFTNCTTGDPLYVDRTNRNYHIQAGSAAIGKVDSSREVWIPALDIEGVARVTADAGAYAAPQTAPAGDAGPTLIRIQANRQTW